MKKEELYKEAWRIWGGDMQLDILIEEMDKLTQAIIKARQHNMRWCHEVLEEMVGVIISLELVETRLKALPTDIDRATNRPTGYLIDIVEEIKARKLARLEKRLFVVKKTEV